ncbi:MAG: DUF7453 family protein [Phycisphaerales bacterium]
MKRTNPMTTTTTVRSAILAGTLLALAGTALAGTAPEYKILVKEGDMIPGIAEFFRVDNVAVNNVGQWLVEGDTTFPDTEADTVLLNNAGVLFQEGQSLSEPAGAFLDSFDAVTINNNGDTSWNFFLDGTSGSSDDSGVYFNQSLVIQESFVSTAPELSPGTPYIGFFETKINDANQIFIVASVDDPAIASSVDRALVRVDYDPNTGSFTETAIAKEGDDIFGSPVTDFGTGPEDFAFNNDGDSLYTFDTTAATSMDSGVILHSAGSGFLVALEGQPSPVPGRNWGSFSSVSVDLSNEGSYLIRGDLDGATTDDAVLVLNDGGGFSVVAREGDTVPASLGGVFTYENFGLTSAPVFVADTDEVLYYAEWSNPDTSGDTALMIDLSPILLEGTTLVEDFKVIGIANGQDAFQFSDNGRFIIAEVTLEDPATLEALNAAILIDRFPPVEPTCPGDADGDGDIDSDDLAIILTFFGCSNPDPELCPSIDGDGDVDSNDLSIVLSGFGSLCDPI